VFITHKLKKGEDFKSVMRKYGVKDWNTTWNLPQNKSLRTKRKFADKVEPGDTLVILDPKEKLRSIKFAGVTFNIPDAEWDATKRGAIKLMETKFLPKLISLKKIYDEDYEYMWDIANNQGWMTGMMAAIVENRTNARIPTAEMSKTTKAIGKVQKAIKGGDFYKIMVAMGEAETAMKDYVKAAETYRRKMTDGSTETVKFLEITRDGCFILAAALATGGAAAAAPGVFTAAELGAAMGAGSALLKSAGNEVGNVFANEKRSAGQISYAIIRDTYMGAATGALGGALFAKFGAPIAKFLAKYVQKYAPTIVNVMLRNHETEVQWATKYIEQLGREEVAKIIADTAVRSSVSTIIKAITEWLKAKDGIDALVDAAGDVMKSLTGKEKEAAVGQKLADKLAANGAANTIVAKLVASNKAAAQKALDKKLAESVG